MPGSRYLLFSTLTAAGLLGRFDFLTLVEALDGGPVPGARARS